MVRWTSASGADRAATFEIAARNGASVVIAEAIQRSPIPKAMTISKLKHSKDSTTTCNNRC